MVRNLLKTILPQNIQNFLWRILAFVKSCTSLTYLVQKGSRIVYLVRNRNGRPSDHLLPITERTISTSLPIKRVVVWGHKYNGNTYNYIQTSYFKAFKSQGFETYHFDDFDIKYLSRFNFDNCLFVTEGHGEKNIPVRKSSMYILHHVNPKKYLASGAHIINFTNYQKSCEVGKSPAHPEGSVVKVDDCAYWDEKNKTLYQPWATDLLPHEIDVNNFVRFDLTKKKIHYIGDIYGHNRENMERFGQAARDHNIKFVTGKNISIKRSHKLVRESYISVDIRGPWHIECGYLPCRVFKNISYGKFLGVNSENIHAILGDYVAYNPDTYQLFETTLEAYKKMNSNTMRQAMQYVKDKHTYVNRIHNLLKLLATM